MRRVRVLRNQDGEIPLRSFNAGGWPCGARNKSLADGIEKVGNRVLFAMELDADSESAPNEVICPKCKSATHTVRTILDGVIGRRYHIFDCHCGHRIWVPAPRETD
jgi:hypothetical protein